MKIGIYVRVSTNDQKVENQLFPLRDHCARQDYQIEDEYIDHGFSGKDDKRPEFERLLNDVRANRLDCVLVYKLDRIGRSLQHLIGLLSEFKKRKVQFISFTQPIDTTTAEGKMFLQLLGVFAEYERELIVARTKAGLDRAKRQGKSLGRPKGSKDKKLRRKSGYHLRWVK